MKKIRLLLCFLLIFGSASAQTFEIIPLGVYGGGDESNLSCYLAGAFNSNEYIALDAGSLRIGIRKAIHQNHFLVDEHTVLQDYIKGYFISHGHLDHLSGLIINSPDDSSKPIYALPFVIDVLKYNYFTNASWANFGSEGDNPVLNKYTYKRQLPHQRFPVLNTDLTAEVFELSHVNPQKSSAILLEYQEEYLLYLGDTGADRIEKTDYLDQLWQRIAPLLDSNKLKAILIEVSFPNSQPEHLLFGHLTPKLLAEELQSLSLKTKSKSLHNLNVIVTHLKPGSNNIKTIKRELLTDDSAPEVRYIFPKQGEKLVF